MSNQTRHINYPSPTACSINCPRCGGGLDFGTTGHDFKMYYWAGCGRCGIYASSFEQDDLILQLKQRVRFPYNGATGGKIL